MEMNKAQQLDGKIALVTGAAGGLGSAISQGLVQAGAKVMITDILEDRGQSQAYELSKGAFL